MLPGDKRGWNNPLLLICAFPLLLAVEADKALPMGTIAAIDVKSPPSLTGITPGFFGAFSVAPSSSDMDVLVPEGTDIGCGSYTLPGRSGRSIVALVRRGNCSFFQKALNAEAAGASGVMIIFDSEEVFVMGAPNETDPDYGKEVGIFAVAIGKSFGEKLYQHIVLSRLKEDASNSPVVLSVSVYSSSILNLSEVALLLMATALVAAGAFFSTADMKQTAFSAAIAPPQDEILEVDSMMAGSFFFMGSAMLVFLFFFMNYMIYVIIFAFCVGGASCITQFGSLALAHYAPALKRKLMELPVVGPVTQAEVIAFVPAVMLVVSWVVLRNTPYGWPFQDIIGAGFLCWMQRTLRLPNIKIATLLLTAMLFFDIFWVFLSPLIFTKSVMVTVATGGDTGESVPMLLRIPSFGDPLGRDRLLGFGDIALPGLLVSYLRRHDLQSHRRFSEGYFGPSLIGYFVGLCATIAALILMRMGQPALLYLVPCTLGTTLVLASRRGEVSLLWIGKPANRESAVSMEDVAQCQSDGP